MIEGRWSPNKPVKAAAIISQLITEYRPTMIVIKRPHPSRTSKHLDAVCRSIATSARDRHVRLAWYSIDQIKESHGQDTKTGIGKLAQIVSINYPILARELRNERELTNPYHIRMFEAVLLGSACLRNLNRQSPDIIV
ncbi:MAG: hypothetical protein M1305_07255 [Candidatus Marsarchaeota archaeon]|nr:hypothetical protein [Candidatus Marsarchaeota archaeon]